MCQACGALNDAMDAVCADCGATPDARLADIELGYWCLTCCTESPEAYCGVCGLLLLPSKSTAVTGTSLSAVPVTADRSTL